MRNLSKFQGTDKTQNIYLKHKFIDSEINNKKAYGLVSNKFKT
jgi:hypothetical protein